MSNDQTRERVEMFIAAGGEPAEEIRGALSAYLKERNDALQNVTDLQVRLDKIGKELDLAQRLMCKQTIDASHFIIMEKLPENDGVAVDEKIMEKWPRWFRPTLIRGTATLTFETTETLEFRSFDAKEAKWRTTDDGNPSFQFTSTDGKSFKKKTIEPLLFLSDTDFVHKWLADYPSECNVVFTGDWDDTKYGVTITTRRMVLIMDSPTKAVKRKK